MSGFGLSIDNCSINTLPNLSRNDLELLCKESGIKQYENNDAMIKELKKMIQNRNNPNHNQNKENFDAILLKPKFEKRSDKICKKLLVSSSPNPMVIDEKKELENHLNHNNKCSISQIEEMPESMDIDVWVANHDDESNHKMELKSKESCTDFEDEANEDIDLQISKKQKREFMKKQIWSKEKDLSEFYASKQERKKKLLQYSTTPNIARKKSLSSLMKNKTNQSGIKKHINFSEKKAPKKESFLIASKNDQKFNSNLKPKQKILRNPTPFKKNDLFDAKYKINVKSKFAKAFQNVIKQNEEKEINKYQNIKAKVNSFNNRRKYSKTPQSNAKKVKRNNNNHKKMDYSAVKCKVDSGLNQSQKKKQKLCGIKRSLEWNETTEPVRPFKKRRMQ